MPDHVKQHTENIIRKGYLLHSISINTFFCVYIMQIRYCLPSIRISHMHHPINVQMSKNALKCHFQFLFEATFLQLTCTVFQRVLSYPACCGNDRGRRWESINWEVVRGRERESPSHAISGSSAWRGGSVCKLSATRFRFLLKIAVPYLKVSSSAEGRNERDCALL